MYHIYVVMDKYIGKVYRLRDEQDKNRTTSRDNQREEACKSV